MYRGFCGLGGGQGMTRRAKVCGSIVVGRQTSSQAAPSRSASAWVGSLAPVSHETTLSETVGVMTRRPDAIQASAASAASVCPPSQPASRRIGPKGRMNETAQARMAAAASIHA